MKRVTVDADVANACLFLASDVSRQITGVDLPVDGRLGDVVSVGYDNVRRQSIWSSTVAPSCLQMRNIAQALRSRMA